MTESHRSTISMNALQRVHVLAESPYIDANNYRRVCLYLLRMADYMPDQDDLAMMLEVRVLKFSVQLELGLVYYGCGIRKKYI